MDLKIKRITETAKLPIKNYKTDAGYDLYVDEEITIPARCFRKIRTGIAVKLPENTFAFVVPRSGFTVKSQLRVTTGTIDEGYQGEISILVDNIGVKSITLNRGMRLAQLVIIERPNINLTEVEAFEEETERGEKGFGSSDVSEEKSVNRNE